MLNFIYYPISAVLWFWHKVLGFVLSPDSGITWALSILFLVFTVRILLVKPTADQLRSGRRMAEFQPKMQELQKKHKNDRQTLSVEVRKLQKEMGVNPLASCLPMFVQIPIFIGLFHVLRSFNRTGTNFGELGMTIEQTRSTPNYVFGVNEVQSFLDARLFGTPLSAFISMSPDLYPAFSPPGMAVDFTRSNIMTVVIPLMLASAVMMHFSARMSLDRQKKRQAAQPKKNDDPRAQTMQMQMDMMQKMMLWVMPILYLMGGFMWQVGLALYMFTNNLWTMIQQKLLFAKMDREEAEEKEAKAALKRTSAPKVGVKPNNPKRKKSLPGSGNTGGGMSGGSGAGSTGVTGNGEGSDAGGAGAGSAGASKQSTAGERKAEQPKPHSKNSAGRSTPKVGVKPNNPKRKKGRKR